MPDFSEKNRPLKAVLRPVPAEKRAAVPALRQKREDKFTMCLSCPYSDLTKKMYNSNI
jgi:hypothetical protein